MLEVLLVGQAWTLGGGRPGRSLPVPSLPVAASWGSVTVCPFMTSCWGPSPSLGGVCFPLFSGVFPSPTPSLGSPLFPPSVQGTACSPSSPLPFTGEETETTKGEVSSPGQGWVCFVDTRLGGRGLCPLRAYWPPSSQHFSAINNPLQMPQIPGAGSPEEAPEVWGWEVERGGNQ